MQISYYEKVNWPPLTEDSVEMYGTYNISSWPQGGGLLMLLFGVQFLKEPFEKTSLYLTLFTLYF